MAEPATPAHTCNRLLPEHASDGRTCIACDLALVGHYALAGYGPGGSNRHNVEAALDRIAARVVELETELEDRSHPRHTIGTLSWVNDEMRARGHVCIDRPKPETCPACIAEEEKRDGKTVDRDALRGRT